MVVGREGNKSRSLLLHSFRQEFLFLTMSPGIVKVFDIFRDDIDQHNDRRERLIKVCSC